MESIIGENAVVYSKYDDLGNKRDDDRYIGMAYKQIVKIIAYVPNVSGFYITDFFIPEHIEEKNDYIHYGFLIVSNKNITILRD